MTFRERFDGLLGVGARSTDPHELRRHRLVVGIAGFAALGAGIAIINCTLQGVEPFALMLGATVASASLFTIAAARRGRFELGAGVLIVSITLAQTVSGVFRDGFFIMVSPTTIATLVMTIYLVGPKSSGWFALLSGAGMMIVFGAHMTGHVIQADLVPGDPRPMLVVNALLGLPAVWYFQRLDRLAKDAADARLAQNREELLAARTRLSQTDKLAAVGQLAAGVAHEINNPLAVILAFAQGIERRLPEGSDLTKPVASILRESLRCRDLVGELLTFSRAGRRDIERFDVNDAVRAAIALVEPRAKMQGVGFDAHLTSDVLPINASRMQVEQVVLNLANNALDAMDRGGTLTVRTTKTDAGSAIEVADTGCGIAADVRERVFEPFFTTKPVGKGTGLGLSISWEIVQQLGGVIDLASELGRGTTMTVKLPAAA